jgi:hypothetical protein
MAVDQHDVCVFHSSAFQRRDALSQQVDADSVRDWEEPYAGEEPLEARVGSPRCRQMRTMQYAMLDRV